MGIISFFKGLVNKEEVKDNLIENSTVNNVELEIDDEDRIVVAIAASIMAGKDKPNSQFHISKIRRIK
jgi:hypothetical protein